jgi:hypothetical protein
VKSLEELSDRQEIDDLLVDYCYAIDFHRWDDLDAVFTPDATLDLTATGGEAGDFATMKQWLARTLELFTGHQHLVATSKIELPGDRADDLPQPDVSRRRRKAATALRRPLVPRRVRPHRRRLAHRFAPPAEGLPARVLGQALYQPTTSAIRSVPTEFFRQTLPFVPIAPTARFVFVVFFV